LNLSVMLCFAVIAVGCVTAKDGDLMRQDIIALKTQLESLQQRTADAEGKLTGEQAALRADFDRTLQSSQINTASDRVEMTRIKRDLVVLNGMIEKQGFDLQQEDARIWRRLKYLETRLTILEAKLGVTPPKEPEEPAPQKSSSLPDKTKEPEAPPVVAPEEAPVKAEKQEKAAVVAAREKQNGKEDPWEEYQAARSVLREQKDSVEARRQLAGFLKTYPNHSLSDNAQYLIGESYYVDKNYHQAVMEFQKVVDKYPKDDMVPEALLMLGHCFKALDMKEDAKLFYDDCITRYPKTKAAQNAKSAVEKLKK